MYPSPTTGEVNIDMEDYLGRAVRIEVYSLLGQLVYFVEIDEVQTAVTKLDLSVYQNGTYLIRVHTDGEPDTTKWVKLLMP
ncbi:MAG: T9SS type A sorting domain-containing protein [Saprospiraceae bacterium]|nr:T9SS type A sorting domain-containing protein [Saprospiraceae bacterium]